jgi:hypothetical protein
VDDEPDDADDDEEGKEGEEQPETSGKYAAVAVDLGVGGEIDVAAEDGDVAQDLRVGAEVEVSAEDGDMAGDGVGGIDGDVAHEDGYIAFDVTVDVDGAEGTGDIACGLSFSDGDVVAHAGAILLGLDEGGEGYEKEGGEKQLGHEESSLEVVYGGCRWLCGETMG